MADQDRRAQGYGLPLVRFWVPHGGEGAWHRRARGGTSCSEAAREEDRWGRGGCQVGPMRWVDWVAVSLAGGGPAFMRKRVNERWGLHGNGRAYRFLASYGDG